MQFDRWYNRFKNNSKVMENYFFMTALQVINSFFGILIYPYVIRMLGADAYGLYIFALSITSYFVGFVAFGFTMPAVTSIVQNKDNIEKKSNIVSHIISAKVYLALIASLVFIPVLFFVPLINTNKLLFIICFAQILSEIFFPSWFFQAIQKMKIITYIQLGCRLLSLPFIFLFVKNSNDLILFVTITILTGLLGSLISMLYIYFKEHIKLRFIYYKHLKGYYSDALPFFWTSAVAILKQQSVTNVIGVFFGMKDVAIYDLANKIISVPRMLTMSINGALFPKVIDHVPMSTIKKIIRVEVILGLSIIALVVIFGRWAVILLGGYDLIAAYPIAIILSGTILAWLVVGCYNNFIFVPLKKYYYVFQVQIIALISMLLCMLGVFLFKDIIIIALAYTISGFSELAYGKYLIKKHKMA